MSILRRSLEYLDRNLIDYMHTTHPNAYRAGEVAEAEHVPAHKVAKTVIFCGDSCYAIAVLPGDAMIDLDWLAERIGVNKIRLATEGEVVKLFPDGEVGAMPPLGSLFNLPVYVDAGLADDQYIVFNAGTHRDAIHMSFTDFLKLVNPVLIRFAREGASVP